MYSKINIKFFKDMLFNYHDTELVSFLEFGFPLSCEGNCTGLSEGKNHAGARNYPDEMEKYLYKECTYGSIIGSFFKNPFQTDIVISPLNSVPKRDSDERRIILDLSFGEFSESVNGHICKDSYMGNPIKVVYPSIDSLVELIRIKGPGCQCFKRDLKRAYRQIPCCPGDWHLVGFSWKGHIFFDRVLSMGLRSAAYICQRVTNSVAYIMDHHYRFQIINYLDDFAGCETPGKALHAYETLGQVLKYCGLEESVSKAVPPSTSMVFLGILVDTISCTLSITRDRLDEISALVEDWLGRSRCSFKDLQSLLGKLHFVSSCVRPGRLFVSRLLTWLRTFHCQNISKRIPNLLSWI